MGVAGQLNEHLRNLSPIFKKNWVKFSKINTFMLTDVILIQLTGM